MYNREKILIVDDEPTICQMLTTVLSPQFDCISAGSMMEAEGVIERVALALVVIDLGLPDSDGSDTVKRIVSACDGSKMNRDVAVVAVTGGGDERTPGRVFDAGANDFISKPTGLSDLVRLRERLDFAIARGRRRASERAFYRDRIDRLMSENARAQATHDALEAEYAALLQESDQRVQLLTAALSKGKPKTSVKVQIAWIGLLGTALGGLITALVELLK